MARAETPEARITEERGYRIRRRELPSGTVVYQVDLGTVAGRRRRQQFSTLTEARAFCRRLSLEKERVGVAAFALSDQDREDAVQALQILAGTGGTLTAAATAYARQHPPADSSVTILDIFEGYLGWAATTPKKLRSRAGGGYRPAALRRLGTTLRAIARDLGKRPAAGMTPDDWQTYLDSLGGAPATWGYRRGAARTAYAWATRPKGILAGMSNPLSKLDPPGSTDSLPSYLTPAELQTALGFAAGEARPNPQIIAALAIGAFAGCRPTEIQRLTPADINLSAAEICISASVAKTHQARLVIVAPNLAQWLTRYPVPSGKPMAPSDETMRGFRRRLAAATGLVLGVDVLRHSAATYTAALHGLDFAARQLGHQGTGILNRHYLALASGRHDAAIEYYSIMPPGVAAAEDPAPVWRIMRREGLGA